MSLELAVDWVCLQVSTAWIHPLLSSQWEWPPQQKTHQSGTVHHKTRRGRWACTRDAGSMHTSSWVSSHSNPALKKKRGKLHLAPGALQGSQRSDWGTLSVHLTLHPPYNRKDYNWSADIFLFASYTEMSHLNNSAQVTRLKTACVIYK